MDLNLNRALKASFAQFAFNSAVIAIFGNILGVIVNKLPKPELVGPVVVLIIGVAIVYYVSLWYFQHQKAGWENGVILGAAYSLFGIVVALIQTIPVAISQSQLDQLGPYFKSLLSAKEFWISVAATVLAAAYAGYVKNPKA